jgi:DNA-directed RNA polymerase subunit omega
MDLPSNIDSKFSYILIAAKRARQLQSGVRPLVQSAHKKSTKIAQQEVSAGLIPVEYIAIKTGDDGEEK